MNPKSKALLFLHLSTVVWGFTAILGKFISYGTFPLVYHRMLITGLAYMLIPAFWRGLKQLSRNDIINIAFIGLIVCGHWLSFYGSIKIGNNVSVTLAALGTASLFSAFIDPWINKRRINSFELLLGLLIILGVLFVCYAIMLGNEQKVSDKIPMLAVWVGIISAALAALFTALNKKRVATTSALTLSGIEMISGAAGVAIFLTFYSSNGLGSLDLHEWRNTEDLIALLLLAIVCTNLTFWLGTLALKHISAFTANLTVNLEPIYGMIFGAAIFKEYQSLNGYFYMGASIILASIFANPLVNLWRARHQRNHQKPA